MNILNNNNLCLKEKLYILKALFRNEENFNNINNFSLKILENAINLRLNNFPLAKIIQKKEFYKYVFKTTNETLDPRPETEFLIEEALKLKPKTILELGTGTGCIILSLLKELPKAKGTAIDISKKALKIAHFNSINLKINNNKINFIENNFAFNLKGEYDLVISNPPYINFKELMNKEAMSDPEISLFGNETTYYNLIDSLEKIKFKVLLLEIPEYLLNQVINYLKTKFINSKINYEEIYNSKIFCLKIIL